MKFYANCENEKKNNVDSQKWAETQFLFNYPTDFSSFVDFPHAAFFTEKYSSKPILHGFYKGSGLAWQSMHYLQLHATSFYELFAYNFTATGHFVIEMCNHNLLQVSPNLFLGHDSVDFIRNVHGHRCFLPV